MKRSLLSLLLLITFAAIPIWAADWSPIADKVVQSIAFLDGAQGSCTAFVIDQNRGYVLTAAHCYMEGKGEEGGMQVDNIPAKVVAKDQKKDLMVLKVEGINRPALKLAAHNPKVGEEVASYGYGLGLEHPLFRVTHVSSTDTTIDGSGLPEGLIAVDSQFVAGQSGGPVVNTNGEVVMVVEAGGQGIGLGPGAETIKSRMGRYFQQEAK